MVLGLVASSGKALAVSSLVVAAVQWNGIEELIHRTTVTLDFSSLHRGYAGDLPACSTLPSGGL